MDEKRCVACNLGFPDGAWTCPYCGAGPINMPPARWNTWLRRTAVAAKVNMYCASVLAALTLIVQPKIVVGSALLAAIAFWFQRYFQERLKGKDAYFAAGVVVRNDDSEGKKRFVDSIAACFSMCAVGLLVLEAGRTVNALLA